MKRALKRNLIVAATSVAVVGVVLYLTSGNDTYDRRQAMADSGEVQRSLEILRGIAADPESVPQHMSKEAKETAKAAVTQAAELMGRATSIEVKDAAWFGEYLRVGVTCARGEGEPIERYFFLKKEGGELRITGLQL